MRMLAIDPGPVESAWVLYDTNRDRPIRWGKDVNRKVCNAWAGNTATDMLAIEMIASYGMPVGREVFETCVWIGRFIEHYEVYVKKPVERITRGAVKSHLCHSAKAKDANVRQALIDRFGSTKEEAIGRKATPGPLYGLTGDCWAALGVAVTATDQLACDDAAPQLLAAS